MHSGRSAGPRAAWGEWVLSLQRVTLALSKLLMLLTAYYTTIYIYITLMGSYWWRQPRPTRSTVPVDGRARAATLVT